MTPPTATAPPTTRTDDFEDDDRNHAFDYSCNDYDLAMHEHGD
jgi:hypothetical protein